MAQLLLEKRSLLSLQGKMLAACLAGTLCLTPAGFATDKKKNEPVRIDIPELLLDGGRKLRFERMFSTEQEVKPKKGFWTKVVDVVIGAPDYHTMVRPYSITTDSKGRIIVTDPGAHGVHIFDFNKEKYKFLSRQDTDHNPLVEPQCVAVDAEDRIYVTDSDAGKIFVFNPSGKLERVIGALKYGEGFFKRPTGIAIDSAAQRIYVSDTLRDQIFEMDMQGSVLRKIGKRGTGDGEFNYPTELRLHGDSLAVVDAMNFRVQVLDKNGEYQYSIGKIGDHVGSTGCGVSCRCSIGKDNCFITSGSSARRRAISSCPRACASTTRTGFMWWIRSTSACRCITISARRAPRAG